jgi:hypothetical protein
MIRHLRTVALLLVISPAPLDAREALPWLPAGNRPRVTVHPAGKLADASVVQVTGETGPTSTTVLEVDSPEVPSHRYVLRGRIRYEGVEGAGFVEMLSVFPGRGTFFTRTLGEVGPLARLSGSGDWRDLELPFLSEPGQLPEKLVVNVVLPGKGTVYLTPLMLSVYEGGIGASAEWWSERQGGLVGGLAGSTVGLLGALVGTLVCLARARGLVMTVIVLAVVLGAVSFVAAIVALALGQPYHVYYPLLLLGILSLVLFGSAVPIVRRRYNDAEMRRMAALDAG